MTREELARASDMLESAAESTGDDDDAERLRDVADRIDSFATAERGPDHGQLARVENALHDLSGSTSGDTVETIDEAHHRIKEYRSGVDGV